MPNHAGDAGAGPGASGEISSAAEQAADVLLDRIQLGVDVQLPVRATARETARFCAALFRSGFLARKPLAGVILGKRLPVGPATIALPGGASGSLTGQLVLVKSDAGNLQVRRDSILLPNPMRALRSTLPSPLAAGPNGQDNLAAPYSPGAYVALLPLQLQAVAAAVDAFVAALAHAARVDADLLGGKVWVQHAEFCLDYQREAAEDFVRSLRDRPIRGALSERERYFSDQHGNGLCVSWRDGGKSSPETKVYAKRPDLVRVEISLRERKAVMSLLKRLSVSDTVPSLRGAHVAAELASLARGAHELLDDAVGAINEGLEAVPRTGADFVLAFTPLLRLISPPPRAAGAAGRPRGVGVELQARLALERLLAEGKFDMKGEPTSSPVLVALKEMQEAGTLAVAPRQPRLFTVAPELEEARQALAGVEARPLGGG